MKISRLSNPSGIIIFENQLGGTERSPVAIGTFVFFKIKSKIGNVLHGMAIRSKIDRRKTLADGLARISRKLHELEIVPAPPVNFPENICNKIVQKKKQ